MNPLFITYAMWITPASIALAWGLWEIIAFPTRIKNRRLQNELTVTEARIAEVIEQR